MTTTRSGRASLAACVSLLILGAPGAVPAEPGGPYWVFLQPRDAGAAKRMLQEPPTRWVSERALARRARRGSAPLASAADLPVDADAQRRVLATGARRRAVSRWLHAVSVDATAEQLAAIRSLDCVAAVRPVAGGERRPIPEEGRSLGDAGARARSGKEGSGGIDYGDSFEQLEQIGVPDLHGRGYCGAGVMVGVLDTGFELDHPAFAEASVIDQYDFVYDDGNVADEPGESGTGHGTAVLSLIAGFDPGSLIGAAYGADYVLAKTEDETREVPLEEDHWVAGIEWAESLGVDLVSSSLGYIDWYEYADMDGATAVTTIGAQMAVERGVVVVNAAGNERDTQWHYIIAPADAEDVISVGAVDGDGVPARFSSVGPTADGRLKPDVVARGSSNRVARVRFGAGSPYGFRSGTSFAAPLVAGVAALILEAHPGYSPADVGRALRETASLCAQPDTLRGYGLVRAGDALDYAFDGACGALPPSGPRPRLVVHRPRGDLFVPSFDEQLGWSLELEAAARVRGALFDASGRLVAGILDASLPAGESPLAWDGRLATGEPAPSGIYLLRLRSSAGTCTERLLLLR